MLAYPLPFLTSMISLNWLQKVHAFSLKTIIEKERPGAPALFSFQATMNFLLDFSELKKSGFFKKKNPGQV